MQALLGRHSSLFLSIYAFVAYYFANKMMRLIILTGPIASSLCGVAIGFAFDWCQTQFLPVVKVGGSACACAASRRVASHWASGLAANRVTSLTRALPSPHPLSNS